VLRLVRESKLHAHNGSGHAVPHRPRSRSFAKPFFVLVSSEIDRKRAAMPYVGKYDVFEEILNDDTRDRGSQERTVQSVAR
jgi:hypothetical protein